MSGIDHILTDDIVCPYCGNPINGAGYIPDDIIKGKIICGLCNERFEFYADTKIVWVTSRIK